MAKILILAKSGFGKTTSYCGREKLGIKGLDPKETYVIQCVGRGVPNSNYKLITEQLNIVDEGKPSQKITNLNILTNGNRIQVDNYTGLTRFTVVAEIINRLKNSPYKNIVIDDFNYLAQDFYMANAMKGGWDKMYVPAQSNLCENNWIKTVKSIACLKNYLYICQPK